jgi:hypothetical protein
MFGLAVRAVLLFAGILAQRESPYWLIGRGRDEEATLLRAIGGTSVFSVFAFLTLVAVWFFVRRVPQTKDRSLQPIEADLRGSQLPGPPGEPPPGELPQGPVGHAA